MADPGALPSQAARVDCTTLGCPHRAEIVVSCEDEGFFPYCRECAEPLIAGGETVAGAVDDPVVAERDRLRAGISWARGMCTDEEPYEKIDAFLGGLLNA